MLSAEEERFIVYWERNREKDKKLYRQVLVGLPVGLLLGAGILLSLSSGWYERAEMVANTQLNPYVLLLGILAIAVFVGIFYKKYRWDMNEQHYLELIAKKKLQGLQQAADTPQE